MISLARNTLSSDSRERARMRSYAQKLESCHVVVLTRKDHGYSTTLHDGNLHLYPTHSRSRIGMLFDAYRISISILKSLSGERVISAQDPLEIGWLSWCIARITHASFHVQVHGDYFSSDAWVGRSFVRAIRRYGALVLLRRTYAIRVVSRRIKESLMARGIAEDRMTVLPIRPELEKFLVTAPTQSTMTPFTFLYFGRLSPEKDVGRIIEAFAVLQRTHPDTKLRIVGEGAERSSLEKLVQRNYLEEKISFVAWTENVPKEIASAHVCLLASHHEAYALALIEAMAVGVPVITTDVGCVGEVVKDGEHGIVVKEAGVALYAMAMARMIVDTEFRHACGLRARKTVEQIAQESSEVYVQAWVNALERAVKKV